MHRRQKPRVGPQARHARQLGITLVELMVALVISSLLVFLIFAIYVKMSEAYRSQNQIADLQQRLTAAKNLLTREVSMAGNRIPNGFKTIVNGTPDEVIPAIQVVNNADGEGADIIRFYYADETAKARVTDFIDAQRHHLGIDDPDDFQVGDIVVITNPSFASSPTGGADIRASDACIVEITAIGITGSVVKVEFDEVGTNYNTVDNLHCVDVQNATLADGANSETMMYRFVGRSYRIDPTRKDLSVLQQSPSGELNGSDWLDFDIGFTNIQVATRYYEQGDATDRDGDGNAERDWYSGDAQETGDTSGVKPANAVMTNLSVSFTLRTSDPVTTVPTPATPQLLDPSAPVNYNRIGDADAIQLEGIADSARAEQHRGDHIYRYLITTIDLRNMGVGQ